MLLQILRFETRFWLKGFMVWVFTLIIGTMIFAAVSSDNVRVGNALENTFRNAPYVIQNFYAVTSLLTLLMTTAFVNAAASRDFAYNTHQIIFSTPLRKFAYLMGRFWGSALVSVIPMLGVSLGVILGRYMPWVDPERWRSIAWDAHLNSIVVFAIPNTLFIAAIIFAIAVLTRSTVASFLGGLVLLVAYAISQSLISDLENERLAMWFDPFGLQCFNLLTKYWTVEERNTHSIGLTGMMLANRALWMGIGAAVFAFAYARFTFSDRKSRMKRARKSVVETAIAAPAVSTYIVAAPVAPSRFSQLVAQTSHELWSLVKSPSFIVIVVAALLNTIPSLALNVTEAFGVKARPVTYNVINMIRGTLYSFLVALITYFAGVLIWRERDAHFDEIHDALPCPNWILYTAKFLSMTVVLVVILALAMVSGIAVQAWHGYQRFQLGLYGRELFVLDLLPFLFYAFLAFFIHVVSPNKYIGYFSFIAALIANAFGWRALKVASNMVNFGGTPSYTYSDFYGFAPYLTSLVWFNIYWLLFCLLLALATILLWMRGRETQWKARFRVASQAFKGTPRLFGFAVAVAWMGVAGWVFYNTKVLNEVRAEDEQKQRQADYEKKFKKYAGLEQPRITAVRYQIDLTPEQRRLVLKGDQTIVNKHSKPITDLHILTDDSYDTELNIDRASLSSEDKRLNYRIYKLSPPLAPGESIQMHYTVRTRNHGFENELTIPQVVQNGTFFNSGITPQIGYQEGGELNNRNDRKKYGLPEKDRMPALERNCTAHCMDTYISNDSDWVTVETVMGTSPDQIAVAPGSLLREWQEGGKRWFHYRLDHKALNFYSFISARYKVSREEAGSIKSEIYYHPEHEWNVARMQQSIRKTIDYCTTNFSPYAHKQARIIEFPRVARFAQAFPGTMPYSESIGFIADLSNPDDIDEVFYVVAHEMGHQWWAHQVIGARMQGATMMSETLAQYTALMVMEKEYGPDLMRKFLKYEMDRYLRSRGRELLKERPLLRVEANQGYIHYNKGSVVMYYLKQMIGEDAVNRALRKLVQRFGYAEPPYPTSYELEDLLRAETPAQYQYLLKDLVDEITLFSNRTTEAKVHKRSDGKFDVTVEAECRKYRADEKGVENEIPVDDWIEVGAFAAPPKGKKYGKTLHRERVHVNQAKNSFTFVTDQQPERAGVDPFLLLVDRVPDDNTKKVEVK